MAIIGNASKSRERLEKVQPRSDAAISTKVGSRQVVCPPSAKIAPSQSAGTRNALSLRRPAVFGLLTLLIAALALTACGSDEPERISARGRSLEVHTTHPVILDKLAFKDVNGQHRVIRPRASNRQLVALDVTIVNRTSLVTPLLIDAEAAQIGDRRGERIDALDPFEASKLVDAAGEDEDLYSPFLWGEVELDREFQVQGWMVFDVPKGLILGSLWWDEVDSIIADFIEYRRRR